METALKLTLEQEFNLRAFRQQIETLNNDQKDQYLVEVLRQLMIKNNVIRHLIASDSEELDSVGTVTALSDSSDV